MEREIYSKTIENKEYKLILEYDKRVAYGVTDDLSQIAAVGERLSVQEFPDRAIISIQSEEREQQLFLDGEGYRELRELLSKDMMSGRFLRR